MYALWAMITAGRQAGGPRRLPWPISATLNTAGALVGALFGSAASPFYAIYLSALRLSRDAGRKERIFRIKPRRMRAQAPSLKTAFDSRS